MEKNEEEIILKKLNVFLLSLLLIIGVMAGCASDSNNNEEQENVEQNQNNSTEENADEDSFPVTVTDGNGEEFTMEEEPETIISLLPSNTEIAYALDIGDKMVGGSDHDNYPEEALDLEKVGGLELNIEAIVALDPDLILGHPSNPVEGIEQLEDAGLTVLTVNDATNFSEVYESIDMLSRVTGTVAKGEEMIEEMKNDLEALEAKAQEIPDEDVKKVYIEIAPAPEIFTPGTGTFEDDIVSLINADNGAKDEEGWVELSEEAIIEMDPDVIILTYDYVEDAEEEVMNRDGWENISAVENEQIIVFDPDLVSRPGPRLVEGAESLAKEIYPDVFGE